MAQPMMRGSRISEQELRWIKSKVGKDLFCKMARGVTLSHISEAAKNHYFERYLNKKYPNDLPVERFRKMRNLLRERQSKF